ncbi:MAG: heavy metal translocating P-type ATPase [Microbacteriaceae bacterium]|jgi:Cd2+/Zn2+-exporting ATPase|nr:heavy metal translocating P-type ATPase [Microbacteriaceae bacterium]MCI1206997.1 heavy metal translocating P-type ATPase [Microbacteriaceae bacterium]
MSSQHEHHGPARIELQFAIASGVAYAAGMAGQYLFHLPSPGIPTVFFLAAYFFGGFFTIGGAIATLRRGRFDVDFLMLVAAIGAAFIGRFAEGAALLFLFSLGHALEESAMARASKSISALAELTPRHATRKRADGSTEEIPVETIVPGDVLIVRPNTRIPTDGFVRAGTSAVDQAAVTGESIPAEKEPVLDEARALANAGTLPSRNRVFAGTVNGTGALEVTATSTAADSTLSRVVELVENANQGTSPAQDFVNAFQHWYVPIVLAGVLATLVVPMIAFGSSFPDAFALAMTVLVAASPCALAIATPSAVLSAIGRAARAGLLIKGGGPLEQLGRIRTIAFDKTGTLTWGQPRLASTRPAPGISSERLAASALAVESLSDHPIAQAVVRDLKPHLPKTAALTATDLTAVTGQGVHAVISGRTVRVGSPRMYQELGIPLPDQVATTVNEVEQAGQTVMIVRDGDEFLGVLGVMDTPRQESIGVITMLRELGVRRMVMISGDHQRVAEAVGAEIGVDEAKGGLLPEDKVQHIRTLAAQAPTAMIGDGVNDAPAMATADVAIAMGAAGSAVALETADIALMGDDLGRLPFAIRLSRATRRIVRQNLIASMSVVALLVVATFLGLAIGPVVLIHEGSTLLVIANALRLLRFEPHGEHRGIAHEEAPGVFATPVKAA